MNPSQAPKSERLLIFFLSTLQFTCIMDFVIMMPLGPQFMRVFSVGTSEFSTMVSAYTFSAAISGLVGSLFIDRFDRKTALLFLYAGFTIATFLCALSPNHYFFVFARMLAGLFGGILSALVFSIIGDQVPEQRRGLATGRVMASFALASILGIPFGLKLAQIWNWRAPFFLLTGMSGAIWIFGAIILPKMTNHISQLVRRGIIEQTIRTLTKANHIRAYLLTAMLMVAGFSVIPFISPYMVSNTGFREEDLMYIYLVGGLFTFFSAPLVGRLADRFGKYRLFAASAVISIVPIWMVTHLGHSPFWLVIFSTTLFMMASSGRMVPAMALITSSSLPEERGGFMSINSSVQQFSSGAATYMAGHIISRATTGEMVHYNRVGYLAVATTVICLWLARRIRRPGDENVEVFKADQKFCQD
jgi:predicted MFS family arabinose efflux permease